MSDCIAPTPCSGAGPCGGDDCTAPVVFDSRQLDQVDGGGDAAWPPYTWQPCGLCGGRGDVLDLASTRALREHGQLATVTAVCGGCLGSGGSITARPERRS